LKGIATATTQVALPLVLVKILVVQEKGTLLLVRCGGTETVHGKSGIAQHVPTWAVNFGSVLLRLHRKEMLLDELRLFGSNV